MFRGGACSFLLGVIKEGISVSCRRERWDPPRRAREKDVPAIGDGVSKGPAGGRPRSIEMKSFSMESGNPGFQSQLCLGL